MCSANQETKMGMDRPHTLQACGQHHQAGFGLEPTRETQSGPAKTDLAQKHRHRSEGSRKDVGRAEEDLPKPSPLEGCCCSPMFPRESRGISQVKSIQSAIVVVHPKESFLDFPTSAHSCIEIAKNCRHQGCFEVAEVGGLFKY